MGILVQKVEIKINGHWCKACGICIGICPQAVYEPDFMGKPLAAKPELCTSCGRCELLCPDFAIQILGDRTNG